MFPYEPGIVTPRSKLRVRTSGDRSGLVRGEMGAWPLDPGGYVLASIFAGGSVSSCQRGCHVSKRFLRRSAFLGPFGFAGLTESVYEVSLGDNRSLGLLLTRRGGGGSISHVGNFCAVRCREISSESRARE